MGEIICRSEILTMDITIRIKPNGTFIDTEHDGIIKGNQYIQPSEILIYIEDNHGDLISFNIDTITKIIRNIK